MDDNGKDLANLQHDAVPTSRTSAKSQHTLLTTAEAAYFLRLSARTLERFRVEGTGPRYTKAGPGKRARVLYHRSDLEDWLNSFQYENTSQYGQDS